MKKLFYVFTLMLFTLYSCEKGPMLSISINSINAPADGNSTTIVVNANNPWNVSSNDWCTVSPSSGEGGEVSVTVTVKKNTTYDARNCTLIFTSAGLTQSISVNQESNYGVVLPKNTYEVSCDAQQISVEVKANVEYDITIDADWIKQSGTKALTSKTYIFNVDANSTYGTREGNIIITEKNSGKSEVIKVKQAQKDAIIISSKEYNLSCDAQNIEVKLQTNIDLDIVIPDAAKNWISHTSTKALVDKTLVLDIKANEGYDARACDIILKMKNNILADTIKIIQAQKYALFLNVDTIKVKSTGETITCELNSNIEYICEINEGKDWIKRISTKGLNEFKETFEILRNQAFAPRNGSIIFRNNEKNIADTLFIIQHQVDTVFVDKKDIKATWEGGEYEVTVCSNVQYDLKLPEWITEKWKTTSSENELLITTYLFEIEENLDIDKEDKIIFTWNNEGKETETKIHISQGCCTIELEEAGTLINKLGQDLYQSVRAIVISGPINGTDILCLNRMNQLYYLNLFNSRIVEGGSAYYENYKTKTDIITERLFYRFGNEQTPCHVILPNNITSIESWAFYDAKISAIDLPITLKEIGWFAFGYCSKLQSITLPDNIEKIGQEAFEGCGLLTKLVLPESLKSLGTSAFNFCDNLKTIHVKALPSKLTYIGAHLFTDNNLGDKIYNTAILYIPKGTRDAYFLTDFGRFKNIIEE